jgi:hypothetical protein
LPVVADRPAQAQTDSDRDTANAEGHAQSLAAQHDLEHASPHQPDGKRMAKLMKDGPGGERGQEQRSVTYLSQDGLM